METPESVIRFWFEDIDKSLWFKKSPQFDDQIKTRFLETHQSIHAGKTSSWRSTALGRLAEIIVLDQFSRNMFRETPEAFASDDLALKLAQAAIEVKADLELPIEKRSFMYMPFMHSESPQVHQQAMKLFSQPGLEGNLEYEIAHKKIIDRFGRYPHRNKILNRKSTAEEIEFLKTPGSSF